jgi:hypothetical protein
MINIWTLSLIVAVASLIIVIIVLIKRIRNKGEEIRGGEIRGEQGRGPFGEGGMYTESVQDGKTFSDGAFPKGAHQETWFRRATEAHNQRQENQENQ